MRNFVVIVFVTTLAAAIILSGCQNLDLKPRISRLVTSGECGVAPHDVEFLAIVTSGVESGDPTGANMWQELTWDFGDGTGASGSKTYHTYADPGTYEVTVTARDDDGDESSASTTIRVTADTLQIDAVPEIYVTPDSLVAAPAGTTVVAGRDTLRLAIRALTCGLDPDDNDAYSRFVIAWTPPSGNRIFGQGARFVFPVTQTDTQWIYLSVEDPALDVFRTDTLFYDLETPPTRYLDFYVDMANVAEIDAAGVHVIGTFNAWDRDATPMSDPDGDEVYFARVEVEPESTVLFRFVNGNTEAGDEVVPINCAVPDEFGDRAREYVMGNEDEQYSAAFATCAEGK